MFNKARLKLTFWYLLIIMLISIVFSFALYQITTQEIRRSLRSQQFRIFRENHPSDKIVPNERNQALTHPELITEAESRLQLLLIFINFGILFTAGGLGYFLAGRTLKPIQVMVEEQNRFITDASHELRTPLTSLRSEIEVNLRDKNLSLNNAKKLLQSNLEEVENLQTLTNDLLEFIQFPKVTINSFTRLSLSEIFQPAIKKVNILAKRKEIVINDETDVFFVNGNKQNLIQLFVILFDNAIKYSNDKTIITLTTQKTDHNIKILVKDQGFGIDEKDLPHIFDRFYRSDKSRTKTTISGYGLGLSIAKKIVNLHKGSINVKSVKDQGTDVIIQLPIV